jgi:hypothetical protein
LLYYYLVYLYLSRVLPRIGLLCKCDTDPA